MMASQPSFFIIRPEAPSHLPDGGHGRPERRIVPLIPIDLLPEWIDVQGIPRQLTLEETAGMTNLGSFASARERLKLRFLNVYPTDETMDDKERSTAEAGRASVPESTNLGSLQLEQSGRYRSNGNNPRTLRSTTQSSHEDLTPTKGIKGSHCETTSITTVAAPTEPAASRGSTHGADRNPLLVKRCQPWCHHGYCARGSSCTLRHKMPQTAEGLAAVGLASWPLWWRRMRFGQAASNSGSSKESLKAGNPSRGWKCRKERKKERLAREQSTLQTASEKIESSSRVDESSDASLGEGADRAEDEDGPRLDIKEEQVELLIDM